MGFLTTSLILGAAGATALASVASAKKSEKQGKEAASLADQRQKSLEDQLKQRQANEPKDSAEARDKARRRQQEKAAAGTGRRDTIITGSLGIPDAGSQNGDKKALGV